MPRVSIGLPVYNGEKFLERALDSILAQTYADFELIISDNASTDATEQICHAYAAKDDRIRHYRNEKNLGAARNFNYAFELSRGAYFKWAAADDLILPDYLARCVKILDSDPSVVIAFTKTIFIDEKDNPIEGVHDAQWDLRSDAAHERFRHVIFSGSWCNVIFGLIRADALRTTRLISDYPGQDYGLLGQLSLIGKFCEVAEYLFLRRLHPNASSQNTTIGWQKQFLTGKKKERIPLYMGRRLFEFFNTIVTSGLSLGQKLSLVGSLFRRTIQRYTMFRLLKELGLAIKKFTPKSSSIHHYDLRTGKKD